MSHSFAQELTLTCPQCGKPFVAQVWLIVDIVEQPDLLERVRAGDLHDLPCPHCGSPRQVDAPLLIYVPDSDPPLVFSPARQTNAEQDREQADSLLGLLAESLGDAWSDNWRGQVAPVAKQYLAVALSDDPDAALERLRKENPDAYRALKARRRTVPPEFADDLHMAEEAEKRYLGTGDGTALDVAAAAWLRIIEHPALPSARENFRLAAVNNAGGIFLRRYWACGRSEDLNRALDLWEQAIAATPADSPDLPIYLNNLGIGLSERFGRMGREADLAEAIRVFQQAVAATPTDSPDLPGYLNNLGTGLSDRYARTGGEADLAEMICVFQQVVAATPADSPDLPGRLNNLGTGLSDRYARTGREADLGEAIRVFRQAVAATPAGSPALPMCLDNLGNGLRALFVRTGREADLTEAIRVYQQAVAAAPADSPDLPGYLNNLGTGFRDRFARTGQEADLAEVIHVFQQVVAATPADSLDLPSYLNNLGAGLRDRYARTGREADLGEAIRVFRQAVATTPVDSPALPGRLNNLGTGLRALFARTGREADLGEAIRVFQQAVAATPADSPDLPGYLDNLGNGLRDRYARTEREADLAEAIRVSQQVVAATPTDSPDLPGYLNNLGIGLSDRYARTGWEADLAEAIRVFQQVVAATPADSPDLPGYLNNLGTGLRDRFARTGQEVDLAEAIHVFQQACLLGEAAATDDALLSARNWAIWAFGRAAWEEAGEAAALGLKAIDRLFTVQLGRAAQESALRQGSNMAALAAYALTRAGKLTKAVEAMEQGRARLLAEAMERNRTDLERLPELGHKTLYDRYQAILQQRQALLQSAEAAASGAAAADDLTGAQRLSAIDAAFADLQAVIAEIQQIGGYADFFARPAFGQIQAGAQATPLAYLLTTSAGGLALIVHAAGITPVQLDGLTDAAVRAWLMGPADDSALGGWLGTYTAFLRTRREADYLAWQQTMDEITRQLWESAMGPLASALHELGLPPASDTDAPQVTLIPAGLLAMLPLHAAWTEDGADSTHHRCFLDEFAVNYAPSAAALRHASRAAGQAGVTMLLAVDEPKPLTHGGPLPNSTAEVNAVANCFARPTFLRGEEAAQAAVLSALPAADVVHLSCHGSNNWSNPLGSGLLMAHDELLTVRDVLALQLAPKRLISLSACETGLVGTALPDEVVMLPSALLQAGFAGAVASLWSVADVSTAMLMARFYTAWREEGLAPVQALRVAQRWVRDTTNREKAAYFRQDMPARPGALRLPAEVAQDFFAQVRQDRLPDACDFAHPFWWAAFTLYGT